jgi:hypothetical protein
MWAERLGLIDNETKLFEALTNSVIYGVVNHTVIAMYAEVPLLSLRSMVDYGSDSAGEHIFLEREGMPVAHSRKLCKGMEGTAQLFW